MNREKQIVFREEVRAGDTDAIHALVESSGYFNAEEKAVAIELIEERLSKGLASGYRFLFAENKGKVTGYSCFGHISGTRASFDLYWIVVLDSERGRKLGSSLLAETEKRIAELGGKRIYVETSSRDQYVSTRSFYLKRGYIEDARIKDFYDKGDSKVIYVKVVG